MYLAELIYKKILKKDPPYYAKYPLSKIIWKPLKKFLNVVIIPNIPFSSLRVSFYRLIGFKIGKNVFIGMKCYLDDVVESSYFEIGDNVTISYGCYFACHGKGRGHRFIKIQDSVYIGMRSNIISNKNGITIGENTIIGAASLVNKDIPKNSIAYGIPVKFKPK